MVMFLSAQNNKQRKDVAAEVILCNETSFLAIFSWSSYLYCCSRISSCQKTSHLLFSLHYFALKAFFDNLYAPNVFVFMSDLFKSAFRYILKLRSHRKSCYQSVVFPPSLSVKVQVFSVRSGVSLGYCWCYAPAHGTSYLLVITVPLHQVFGD